MPAENAGDNGAADCETTGKNGGMANVEKSAAAAIYEYAKLTTTPPKPKASTAK